jgi:alpha-tubulin suppressor-like RCC1 family protein
MNSQIHTPTRARAAIRWALPLLLALGLLALTPVRADAAPLAGISDIDGQSSTTCVRTTNGRARCWGEGTSGQLGNGGFNDAGVAVAVQNFSNSGPLLNVTQVTSGGSHSCALLASTRAACWGDDSNGQLGNGVGDVDSAVPRLVRNGADTAPLSGITEISAGASFTCARLQSGQARCWGNDQDGQLGDGGADSFEEQLPRIVASATGEGILGGITQITTGTAHACVRLNNGTARCWGQNSSGQVGDNTVSQRSFPVLVRSVSGVANLTGVTSVSAGGKVTCARLSNNQARCWGDGEEGQLGNADNEDSERPVVVRAPVGPNPLTGVTQVAAASDHVCFRLTNAQLRCTGDDASSELGNPNIASGSLRPVIVRNANNSAALGNVTEVALGTNFSCVRLSIGQARCWGSDLNQSLGNAGAGDRALPGVVQLGA